MKSATAAPSAEMVTLSLISHTNAGKTSLARTLLRRDVGEVRDAPHVTLFNESYTLIQEGGKVLRLWDTPGFGDSG
jgi:predicted GTPase